VLRVERRIATVVFVDLVGFTSLAERLDPEDVARIQGAFLALARETISRHRGRLDNFMGDAVMAVFGVPRAADDDAERAVRAGLALARSVEELGVYLSLGRLEARAGVNTGEVLASEATEGGRALVSGDAVNTAHRLQGRAPPGGVLVGRDTALAVADAIELEPEGPLALKGKAQALPAWRVVGPRPERSREAALGRLRAPMIGREAEMALLGSALDRLRAGGPAERWLISAPPGVGKSRLVDEFATRASGDVWRARARPQGVGAYEPVGELMLDALTAAGLRPVGRGEQDRRDAVALLRARLGRAGTGEARAAVVAEHAAGVCWPAIEGGASAVPWLSAERDALFEAWLDAMDVLGDGAPVVWIVEDVHWAGGDLLAFLDRAVRRPGGRWLVLMPTRPALLEREPAWSAEDDEREGRVLHLPQLTPGDARALITALAGEGLPDDVAEQITHHSDGNPLFVEEVLRSWVAVELLVPAGEGWRLRVPPAAIEVPRTIQAVYAAQIDDLPVSARDVARRGAVAGRRFPVGALPALGVADWEQGVASLVRRALLGPSRWDARLGDTHAYRHALLRDAAYAGLPRAERARLHVALARWVERVAGDRPGFLAEPIARAYAAAHDEAPALATDIAEGLPRASVGRLAAEWYDRAADAALQMAAPEAARALLADALRLTPADAALDRARRLLLMAEVVASAADMEEGMRLAGDALSEARRRFAETAHDPPARAQARSIVAATAASLGLMHARQIRIDEGARLVDGVLEQIGERMDRETSQLLVARALLASATTNEPAAGDVERAVAIARDLDDPDLELRLLESFAMLRAPDPVWLASVDLGRVEGLAQAAGRWPSALAAAECRALLALVSAQLDGARRSATRLLHSAEARGAREEMAWANYLLCEVELVAGQWDRGLEVGVRALDLAEAGGYLRPLVRIQVPLVPVALQRGRRDVLERVYRFFAARQTGVTGSPFGRVSWLAVGRWCERAGLPPLWEVHVERQMACWDLPYRHPSVLMALEELLDAWIEIGEIEAAERGLATFAARNRTWWSSPLSLGVEHRMRARLLRAADGSEREIASAERRAGACFRDVGTPWWDRTARRG
jgi:class 3 adenylate cyclase/predicted ATPase